MMNSSKIGGFVGVFLFPVFLAWGGLHLAKNVAALVRLLELAATMFMLPETKGRSLEELSAAWLWHASPAALPHRRHSGVT